MEALTPLHLTNIIVHVSAGSLALLVGLWAIIAKKRRPSHKLAGKIFLVLMAIVILTGLIGVFVFNRNTFLLVITVLSGYLAFSGYRAIKTRSNKPNFMDVAMSITCLVTVLYFLYYFRSIGMIWSPVIIYSTVGYLFFIICYDFARYLIPSKNYARFWIHEHIVKMLGAFSGLLSAFSGTVFPQYQPYSQFLPSVLGTIVTIGFIISAYSLQKNKGLFTN